MYILGDYSRRTIYPYNGYLIPVILYAHRGTGLLPLDELNVKAMP